MDDAIGKVNPINTGKDSLSIRGEHTAMSRPKTAQNVKKPDFNELLHNKEARITEEEKKKKEKPHGKYRDGKRVL